MGNNKKKIMHGHDRHNVT